MPDERRRSAIPAISTWQPYASLIACEVKPWETRHWPPPLRTIGQRIAIHAAVRKPTRDEIDYLDMTALRHFDLNWWDTVPYGAVVCTARLLGAWQVTELAEFGNPKLGDGRVIPDDGLGDYTVGRWCWELRDIERLDPPVPTKGRQGFFNWQMPDV